MKTKPPVTDFDTLLDFSHGKIGTETRSKFEEQSQLFIVSEMLKAARKEANMTQEELAEKVGTKKSYISKLENGKVNVRLSTLIQIFEEGLNRRVGLTFL
jgi:HTH-type transcriptional regulator / antitoxin HipB